LNIAVNTLWSDLNFLKLELKEEYEKNKFDVIEKIVTSNTRRTTKLWNIFENSKNSELKLKCLREIREEDIKLINNLQQLKLLEIPTERVESKNININLDINKKVNDIIEEYESADRERVSNESNTTT
jgi:hypothetical protein